MVLPPPLLRLLLGSDPERHAAIGLTLSTSGLYLFNAGLVLAAVPLGYASAKLAPYLLACMLTKSEQRSEAHQPSHARELNPGRRTASGGGSSSAYWTPRKTNPVAPRGNQAHSGTIAREPACSGCETDPAFAT